MNPLRKFVIRVKKGYEAVSAQKPEVMPQEILQKISLQTAGEPIIIPIQPIALPVKYEEAVGKKRKIEEGVEIPEFSPAHVKIAKMEEGEREKITMAYPLIPKKPAKNETVFAYAKIYWDEKAKRHVYQVVEPSLTERLKDTLKKVKEALEQRLDVDFSKLKILEAKDYLKKQILDIGNYYGLALSETERQVLQYYIERDFIGFGRIEPLLNDEQIEDISCDGLNIPIFVFHRNPTLGSVMTNVVFDDVNELDSFVMRVAQICGKSISVTNPLLSGALPDGSRVQATLATDIARRGSNFTFRKFTEKPLTPVHLLGYKTVDVKSMAYLWFAVDMGKSVLVSGGTASGKTTFLNVLSLFIKPEKKIVSIEDTPELKLPHPHWVPHVARTAIGTEFERKSGEIDLFDLLKESLRQRPDYIIVGEVRGKEAYVLFQEMATGHPSLATIHAENVPKLLDRLTTPPISLPSSLIASVDVIVFLITTRYREKQVRRVTEILEIVGLDEETRTPIFNQIFKWNPINDNFDVTGKSVLLKKISEMTGMKEGEIGEEIERRMVVLDWMQRNNILEYIDVNTIFNSYYRDPSRLITTIKGGL